MMQHWPLGRAVIPPCTPSYTSTEENKVKKKVLTRIAQNKLQCTLIMFMQLAYVA